MEGLIAEVAIWAQLRDCASSAPKQPAGLQQGERAGQEESVEFGQVSS